MKKTTVYLDDDEAERLRELSTRTGTPQAALIREAVRRVLEEQPKHRLRSTGIGRGNGEPYERWGGDPDAVYDWVMGRR